MISLDLINTMLFMYQSLSFLSNYLLLMFPIPMESLAMEM